MGWIIETGKFNGRTLYFESMTGIGPKSTDNKKKAFLFAGKNEAIEIVIRCGWKMIGSDIVENKKGIKS